MPFWPVKLLLKLFGESHVAIDGAARVAGAFLPPIPKASVIDLASRRARDIARRRVARRPTARRALAS